MTQLFQEISKTIKTRFPNFEEKAQKHDHISLDVEHDTTGLQETPAKSWIGDFDERGNLWTFQFGRNQITMIDFDKVAADGNIVPQIFNFAKPMVTDPLWDVAYDAQTQSFYGVTRPNAARAHALLYQIDISGVLQGGTPVFTSTELIGTKIHGVFQSGLPDLAFGVAMRGEDGIMHLAGTIEDPGADVSAQSYSGIYRVVRADNAAILELMIGSPWCNFGGTAVDTHCERPFVHKGGSATEVLYTTCDALSDVLYTKPSDAFGRPSSCHANRGTRHDANCGAREIDPFGVSDDAVRDEARSKFDWLATHLNPDANLSGIESVQRLCPDVDPIREHTF